MKLYLFRPMARSVEGGQPANLTELQTHEAFQSVQVANLLASQTQEAFQGAQVANLPAPQTHEAFGGVHAAIPPASQALEAFGTVLAVLAWAFCLVGSRSSRLQKCCPRMPSLTKSKILLCKKVVVHKALLFG